jgi:UDP-GlcNAc:undecaprenyl-phosphate GlcNAc-1-phosphate transferase
MRSCFTFLVFSSVVTFLITPLARRLAFRWGAVDMPGGRKVHAEPMPRLGGLAVFAGFCAPWGGFYLLGDQITETFPPYEQLFLFLFAGANIMLLMGIMDDIRGLGARVKLLVQIIIATGLYFGGFRISVVSNPFGPQFELGWLALPVSVFWMVWVTNAINLLDGIDGLATGVTACIALCLALINILHGNIVLALLTLCLAGACLGFLPYNFSPARIFLGDSGSLFIGLILSCIGILSVFKAGTATLVAVPLILFAVPLLDTVKVAVGRLMRGVSVFEADKTHVHHQLLGMGLNQKQAAYCLYGVSLLLGASAVFLSLQQSLLTITIFGTLVAAMTLVVGLFWRFWTREGSRAPKE